MGDITYPLYDKVGNRKEELNEVMTTNPFHYTYDYNTRYELEHVADQVPTEQFTYDYDLTGNRLTSNEQGNSSTYIPNILNQYDSVDGVSFTYDLKGNLLNNGNYDHAYPKSAPFMLSYP